MPSPRPSRPSLPVAKSNSSSLRNINGGNLPSKPRLNSFRESRSSKRSLVNNNALDEIQFFGAGAGSGGGGGKASTVLPKVSFPANKIICPDCLISNANVESLKAEVMGLRSNKESLLDSFERLKQEKDKAAEKVADVVRLESEKEVMEIRAENKRLREEIDKGGGELSKSKRDLASLEGKLMGEIKDLKSKLGQTTSQVSDLEKEKKQVLLEKEDAIRELLKLLEDRREVSVKEEELVLNADRVAKLSEQLEEERRQHKLTKEAADAVVEELQGRVVVLREEGE